jgi:hypothetical protein
MLETPHTTLQISDNLTGFIQCGVSISLATADAAHNTSVTKAQGCRVAEDRRRITVFASRAASADLISDLENHGIITAVFCLPSTEETYQIKGHQARLEALQAGDRNLLIAYRRAFAQQVEPFGFPPDLSTTFFEFPDDDLVAISFEPFALFDQTPGPKAGAAVGAA